MASVGRARSRGAQGPGRSGRGRRPAAHALAARNRELERAKADLENVLESLGIPIAIVDAGLRLRRLSASARALLEGAQGDAQRLSELRAPLDPTVALDLLREAALANAPAEREVQDAAGHWHSLRAHPYRTADGRVDGAVLAMLDVDVEKRALLRERAERIFAETVIDTLRDPLAVLDGGLRVQRANAPFRRLFGPAAGHPALGDVLPSECARVLDPLGAVLRGGPPLVDFEVGCNDDHVLLVSASRIPGEAPPWAVATFTDVTERRRARAELERLRQQEVESLRRVNRFKAAFIAAAAHELANPLTPLAIQVRALERRAAQDPALERPVAIVKRSTERLRGMVDDMALAARVETGRLQARKRPVELGGLVRGVLDSYAELAGEKRLCVEASLAEAWVEGDPHHLERLVANLVSNAIKYTPAPGRVEVRVAVAGDGARLEVADDGIGLAPEAAERLFRPFSRVHDPELKVPGTGLGLYICKGIAELHGGTLAARSDGPGRGSVFTLELPALPKP